MIKCLKNSAHICRSGNEYLSVVSKWGYTCILGDNAFNSFPVAQMVEHGVSNAKIMGSIPRESKSW